MFNACLTVDVERRKHSNSYDEVLEDTSKLLDCLRPLCRATFFVTGEIADQKPEVVKTIVREGHEVGCHGLHHEEFDTFPLSEQLRRISTATDYLTNAAGSRPLGFRAPRHRANTSTIMTLERLEYLYDSSVLPRTFFMRPQIGKKWRFLFAPTEPYHPSRTNLVRCGDGKVIELPISTFIVPFVSKLSMRSNFASSMLVSILASRARSRGLPVIYGMHSYDSVSAKEDLDWLERTLHSLLKQGGRFITMLELAHIYAA